MAFLDVVFDAGLERSTAHELQIGCLLLYPVRQSAHGMIEIVELFVELLQRLQRHTHTQTIEAFDTMETYIDACGDQRFDLRPIDVDLLDVVHVINGRFVNVGFLLEGLVQIIDRALVIEHIDAHILMNAIDENGTRR